MNHTTNEPAGIDLDNAALDNLEALARAVDDLPETTQPFVSMGGQVVIHTFSMSPEQVRAVANLYDAATPATIVALIALARRAPAPVEAADEVTRLDILGLIRAQCHRCYASAIDREEIDTKYMAEIDEALKKYALAQQSPAPVVAHDAPEARASQPEGATGTTGAVELSDAGIVEVLASMGVDSEPSKYGFKELQVRTTVPTIRKVVERYLAAPASAQPDRGAAQFCQHCGYDHSAGPLCKTAASLSPASQPVAPEAKLSVPEKAMFWFSCLMKCARLLNLPNDAPIPSGVVAAVEKLVGEAHAQQEAAPVRSVAKVRVTNNGYGMELATYIAYALPEGEHELYAAPVAAVAPSDAKDATVPDHSEREAANAGGRIIVPEWVYRSARDLAVSIWRDNYKDTAPQWEPLDDLAGVVSQIDNMVTGMRRVTGAGNRPEITDDELVAFNRFCECAEDFDSGGHDVPKEMMKRLAVIGLVRPCGFGRHETTLFGDAVRNGNAPATIAAGQEAANTYTVDGVVMSALEYIDYLHDKLNQEASNAKDAARPIPDAECAQGSCARGKDGCRGRCCLAGHKLPIVADIDSAAMAAVGAAGQEGGE